MVLLVGTIVLGCERGAPPSTAPAAKADATDVAKQMRGQFVDGDALKDALVTGRVAVVHEVAARFIARHHKEQFPSHWQARMVVFMDWVQAAAEADDFETAAVAIANVSARCGECHLSEGVQLELPTHAEPDGAGQMQRYRFAIDRMWEGLVVPDPERWRQGAQTYARAVDCSAIGRGETVPEHHTVPCNSILAVAGAARAADTMQARADSFAAVTFNCAGCHGLEPELQ